VIFGIGMVLLAVAGVLAAVASWRMAGLPRWGAMIVAVSLVLYIPQFFAGQPVRIAHGALLAIGCLWLAAGLWQGRSGRPASGGLVPPREAVAARAVGAGAIRLPG
jgi:hypothetical protein